MLGILYRVQWEKWSVWALMPVFPLPCLEGGRFMPSKEQVIYVWWGCAQCWGLFYMLCCCSAIISNWTNAVLLSPLYFQGRGSPMCNTCCITHLPTHPLPVHGVHNGFSVTVVRLLFRPLFGVLFLAAIKTPTSLLSVFRVCWALHLCWALIADVGDLLENCLPWCEGSVVLGCKEPLSTVMHKQFWSLGFCNKYWEASANFLQGFLVHLFLSASDRRNVRETGRAFGGGGVGGAVPSLIFPCATQEDFSRWTLIRALWLNNHT